MKLHKFCRKLNKLAVLGIEVIDCKGKNWKWFLLLFLHNNRNVETMRFHCIIRAQYDSVFLTSISDFSIEHDKIVGQNFNAVFASFFCI